MIDYRLFNKDCRDMSELPDNSIHVVCTSPPYWGLRKYSGEQDLIWGDNHCQHEWVEVPPRRSRKASDIINMDSKEATVGGNLGLELPNTNNCSICGAWRGAFGLEPTLELYIQHSVEILREIRRVLRKDGVVFWNIGDSYYGSWADYSGKGRTAISSWPRKAYGENNPERPPSSYPNVILKPKDLCLIPFRVAIAAQENGWWVRSIIIWSKPNPMPESVKDRPTESHEYILMLTKSARYYWDSEAVREQSICTSFGSDQRDTSVTHGLGSGNSGINEAKRRAREQGSFGGRNLRNVWSFPTIPYPGAHFAVFPEKLPELCIKAATPEVGVCAKCGTPWARILEKQSSQFNIRVRDAKAGRGTPKEGYKATEEEIENYPGNHPEPGYAKTIGWRPSCNCGTDEKVPATVLDPFAGAGTTLLVAIKLGRNAVGYELSADYCDMTNKRINNVQIRYS